MLVLCSLSLLIAGARQTVLVVRLNSGVVLMELSQKERQLLDKIFQNWSIQKILTYIGRLPLLFE